jgi:hypothetical protein
LPRYSRYSSSTVWFWECVLGIFSDFFYVVLILFYCILCTMCKLLFTYEVINDFVIFTLLYYDRSLSFTCVTISLCSVILFFYVFRCLHPSFTVTQFLFVLSKRCLIVSETACLR